MRKASSGVAARSQMTFLPMPAGGGQRAHQRGRRALWPQVPVYAPGSGGSYSLFWQFLLCVCVCVCALNRSVVSDSLLPHGLQPARLRCPWDSPDRYTRVGCHALLQGSLPDPGIEPRSPALQEDSLLSGPPGKPENTGVGSLSLLQGIFPTQESSWGLLHCRQILYQLSYYYPFFKFCLFKFLLFLIGG